MDRIESLRREALETAPDRNEFYYRFYKCYENDDSAEDECYRNAFYRAFSEMTPHISDGELIVGRIYNGMNEEERAEYDDVYCETAQRRAQNAGNGQDSHMDVDYEMILEIGILGIIEKIDGYLENCADEKREFYLTCKKCLEAVIEFSLNYAKEAERLAGAENDSKRREELEEIARICRKVPAKPAESFYEAVQAVHFIALCLSLNPYRFCNQQFQLGHPDRYLLKYYEKDITENKLTKEQAQLLLDLLGIQINMRVPNGLSSGYMVGGRDKNGQLVQNDLTEMLMQVVDDIRLVYPAVGLCQTAETDDKYLKKACEILLHGCSHPAIFNDDVITAGLMNYGVSEEEAHCYIHSTCVEITPEAASNVWVASPYTNMPQILLDVLDREYESLQELLDRYFEVLDAKIKSNFETENQNRVERNENSQNPLLSCFVNDCLKMGTDIEKGGAKYNWIMPSFVGVANLVDSIYAIKELVFDKKEMSIEELHKILEKNFEGNEELRLRILNKIPKYGNDIDEIDSYFGIITEHIAEECKKYTGMHRNGNLIPSVFCWIMHERLGHDTGATPDGRLAGFPLGDGSGPCQGRELNGPTASVLSSTKWSHKEFIGGVAVNMKFSKAALGEGSVENLKNLIKSFLARGGFEMQINVVDKKTLEAALERPEDYRDLVVRIGGYSDYFVRLSENMQREVILRTTHEI